MKPRDKAHVWWASNFAGQWSCEAEYRESDSASIKFRAVDPVHSWLTAPRVLSSHEFIMGAETSAGGTCPQLQSSSAIRAAHLPAGTC